MSQIFEERPAKIPEGIYTAQCISYDMSLYRGSVRKVYLHFLIRDCKYEGTVLFMAANYPKGKKSFGLKICKVYDIAQGRRRMNSERIVLKNLTRRMYRIKVRDSNSKQSDGTSLPAFMKYSVVDHIIEPLTGGIPH